MNQDELRTRLAGYVWYHNIDCGDGITTAPKLANNPQLEHNKKRLSEIDCSGKSVLDVGCRDGLFSFQVERQGAARIVGFDNDLSLGAVEVLIPHFKSKVEMHELNLLDLTPQTFGMFDIVLMLGVLYHLRYPMYGLKMAIGVLNVGGLLVIETAIATNLPQDVPLLFCPWLEGNPYEYGSVSYFNELGLKTVLLSLSCETEGVSHLEGPDSGGPKATSVRRAIFTARKKTDSWAHLRQYWDSMHHAQSDPDAFHIRKEPRKE